MLRFLFPGLTTSPNRGAALFASLVAEARRKQWFLEGGVEDSLDGRFAVLSTVTALATVRLERGGSAATDEAVALAERFIEAMDSEHRQMGIGDPALGKTVRRLVSALGRRVEIWRSAVAGDEPWERASLESLFRGHPQSPATDARAAELTRDLWTRLEGLDDLAVARGRLR